MGSTGQSSFTKIEAAITKVQGKFTTLGMNISQIDAKLESLRKTREISFDSRQIRRINSEIDQLQNKKNRLEGGSRGSGMLGSIIKGAMLFGGLAVGKDIMQAGMGRQMDLTALQTLVGTGPGNQLNAQLIKFAKDSIYGNEVFNEGKLMAGSGVKAGNIMPIMSMIGDLAMGDKERMKSLALAFSEANSTGYLTGRQELMMRTALFNPLESMQKMTGRSGGDLKKDMEKGKISIDMLVKSMEYATGPMGRWHNMMQKMQQTPAGKWIAFTGTVQTLAGTIGLALLPALGHVTDFLTLLVNNVPALYAIAAGIGAMTLAWIGYTAWVERAAIWEGILAVAAYWPLALVGLIVGALTYLSTSTESYGDSTMKTAGNVTTAFDIMRRGLETLVYWAQYAWLTVADVYQRINRVVTASSPGDVWRAIKGFGDDTDASKKRNALRLAHDWHTAMDNSGFDDDGKKKKGMSPAGIMGAGAYQFGGGTDGKLTGETGGSITGGGVRNITININKSFTDKIEVHSVNLKEGLHEVEEMVRDMFLRVTNSAASAMS